jgi:filamentous hemagglutinin
MYAGAIKLVGTEAGVGVKLAGNLAASAGDIELDVNGHLSLAQTAASGAVKINAASAEVNGPVYAGSSLAISTTGDLNAQQNLAARDSISLSSGGQLTNSGIIEAGVNADNSRNSTGDVSVTAQNFTNSGSLIASRTLQATVAQTLFNQGGTISGQGSAQISAGTLDNQNNGRVLSNGSLAVTADQLLNTQGLISSNGDQTIHATTLNNQNGSLTSQAALTVSGTTLNNSTGTLRSQKNLTVQLTGDLNNTQGLLSSEGLLSVSAASLLNRLGSLSSAGQLSVNSSGLVDNQGGQLVTDGGLDLHSASLDNSHAGSLSGKGALSLSTGAFDNSHNGSLSGGSTLALTAGQVTNQDNGRIASAGALSASVTGLDMLGGQLFSNTALSLDLNHGQLNNQNGLINAPILVLNNLNGVANQNGEISSASAFTLAADSLDNSNGKLLSNQALTLRINQTLTNLKGLIAAAALDAHAGSLDNSGSGTVTSQSTLGLTVDGLLNNQTQGLINATTQLTISSGNLNNQGGSLLGSGIALDFAAIGGDLNNSAGLITTSGQLTVNHLRDLNNQNGELSSSQSFSLTGRTLDNTAGKLISSEQLSLNAVSLLNPTGLISGWLGLSVSGGSLDNHNNGTLSSRSGDVSVSLSGALLNSANGALVSQNALTVNADSLDNSGGILSSGSGQTLTVGGLLNNGANGLIDSGAGLTVQALTLSNIAGTINAQQALNISGTDLDNTSGSLVGNAAVTLDLLGSLTNTNGKLASAGPLLIQHANQINNQGGQLASQSLLTLFTGGLDNSNHGTVAASGQLLLTATGAVQNNADGLIYSQNADLHLNAASLANGKGTLQSQGALGVTTTGDIDNQSGKIIAQTGDLTLSANNLDSRGGVLSSLQAAFSAHLTGVLKNGYDLNNNSQGGITQAQNLTISALGGIDNDGGRISAQTGDALITTADFDNRNGGLYAKGKINVTGNNFDNSGSNDGQIAGSQIDLSLSGALNNQLGIIESDSILNITAASVNNQSGKLRALGTSGVTQFTIGGLLDNRNGTLESANTDLNLGAGSFLNAGGSVLHVGTGTLGISTANVMGAGGGSMVTRGGLTLNADTWANDAVIQAGRLTVNVNNLSQTATGQLLASSVFSGSGGNWSNDGLIASDGTLSLNVSGAYGGNGRLSSAGTLGLGAGQVNIGSVGSIAGGSDTTLNASGQLTNYGRVTSSAGMLLNAGSVGNYGTLGSAQALTVTTGSLVNDHGLIFSGGAMSLRVADFTNSYADVYSLSTLSIDRDGAGGFANSIVNSSSSIQSDGNMSLAASTIQNIRAVLTVNDAGIYTAEIYELPCVESHDVGDCSGKQNHVWQLVEREKLEVTAASAASTITAGGNLSIKGGDLVNQSSNIATSGSLTAVLNNLTNSGVETSDIEYARAFRSERTNNASGWTAAAAALTNQYWYQSANYNPNNLSGLEAAIASFIGTTETQITEHTSTTQLATGDQTYSAVIQAAGAVNISTQNNFDNSVVRAGYNYIGSGPRTNTDTPGTAFSTLVTLNQQLPPDLAQQQVNPTTLPGFDLPTGQNGLFRLSGQDTSTTTNGRQNWSLGGASVSTAQHQAQSGSTAQGLTRVQGVPTSASTSQPQKYLIETNPALTDLKQFMSSDYLLAGLGYDPDDSAKRLGDGLYEQKLIEQAIVARTGQAFIDGQTSNEAQLKYLMDNAIASKNELNLTVGVTLTAEQVAALTHDIVWMEDQVVDGQHVLVPVLYLAQADNRLAPNGALIQGSDVTLIAGKNLDNAGTLKATNNLAATAGNDLVNSGLVSAGSRLDLLAGNDLTNKAGGVIAGRDVSLIAISGDVINERTVTTHDSSNGYYTQERQFADSAARVEAANSLTIQAGRDISNTGGVLQAGSDLSLTAGRDVNITSAQVLNSDAHGTNNNSETIVQNGSSVTTGHDLTVQAGRDVTAVASQISAKNDVSVAAAGNLILASAADEEHSYSKTKKYTSQEDHVSQVSTVVTAGGSVALSAGKDLDVIASKVSATDEAYLYAGKDLNLLAAEDTDYSYLSKTKKGSWGKKSSKMSESESDTAIGSVIQAGTKLVISAAQDINAQGATLSAIGALQASAGRDINLDAAENSSSEASANSKKGFFSSKSDSSSSSQTTVTSTELHGQNIDLQADNDIVLKAAALTAQQNVQLSAGRDVVISTVQQGEQSGQSSQSSKFGFNIVGAPSLTQKAQDNQQGSTQSIGSSISAGTLDIKSGRDTTVQGSTLVADSNIQIDAGRNFNVVSAENTSTSDASSSSKKAGEIGSWWQDAMGVVKLKDGNQNDTTQQSGSQIASLGGNVGLTAGDQYNQIASSVIAPAGDISIKAKQVDIEAGFDSLGTDHTQSANRTAIGGSIDIPLVNAVRGIQDAAQSADKTSDVRFQALAAANAAMSAKQAYDAAQTLMSGNQTGIKVSVNLSNSQSHSESSESGLNVVPSTVAAGGDVSIIATGAGQASTLNVIGSSINAGHDVDLKADGDINLLSAQNTATQNSTNANSGWSVGVGFNLGQKNGFTLDLAANAGKGNANGDDVTQTNTQVKAGNAVHLDSAGDTTIKGAVVAANQVQATVGGNLTLESVQDTSTFTSKQTNASVGVSLCIPPFCFGASSGSGSFSQQKMDSDYASVSEQSGIKAGDGGFQVDVKGNTNLVGAVIASTDQAVKDGKNTLSTGSLTSSDIKNKADYDATSIGLSGGIGGTLGRDGDGNVKAGAPGPQVSTVDHLGANIPVILSASGSASSITQSGISGATVKINDEAKQQALTGQTAAQTVAAINTDVSSDKDGSNKLKPIFNADEIQGDFYIAGKFVQNVGVYLESRAKEIDDKTAQIKKNEASVQNADLSDDDRQKLIDDTVALKADIKQISNDWGAGGTYRQIATALVAGISGNVTGVSSEFAQNMLVSYIQQQGSDYIGKLVVAGEIQEGDPIHAALHAIMGCAGAAASSQSCSAGALGGAASSILTNLFANTNPDETQAEREAKSNLITSLVAGIAAMADPSGAATATNAATANVDNNWLATQQIVQAQKEYDAATGLVEKLGVVAKWSLVSSKQDILTTSGIGAGIAQGGWQDVEGLSQFLIHPIDGLQGLASVVSDPKVRASLGDTAVNSLLASIDRMKVSLETGGDAEAVQLGRDLGQLIYTVGSIVTGIGGAAKAGVTLGKVGIEVSSKALGAFAGKSSLEISDDLARLEASTSKNLNSVTLPKNPEGVVVADPPIISKPPVTIKSGLPAIDELPAVEPTAGGYVSGGKLSQSSYAITDLTDAEKSIAATIATGVDKTGALTEDLVESVAQRQGLQALDGGKYGSNNGFDHVYVGPDGSVIVLDSKQIDGGFSLSTAADGIVQMSDKWIYKVLDSLDKGSDAYNAVSKSIENGSLIKGVAGVDRSTGQLIIVKVK